MTHSVFCVSYLPRWCVMNRVVSMAYSIYAARSRLLVFAVTHGGRNRKEKDDMRNELCFSHSPQPTSERSDRPTTSPVTDASKNLSPFAIFSVTNRVVSRAYPIYARLPQFFRILRHPTTQRATNLRLSYNLRPTSDLS